MQVQAAELTGPVEEDSVEADRAAVEVDRSVDVADADADVPLDAADCARAPTAMYAVARRNGRAGTMAVGDWC